MKLKKALIFGISGQDGSYLAKLLLSKKYLVHGVSRKKKNINLKKLNINNKVKISILKLNNEKKIFSILNKGFDEIYFCGGQSNIIDSYNDKEQETYESQIIPVSHILEYIRLRNNKIKFIFSCSSEIFGKLKKKISELDEKKPLSPYGLSKLAAFEIIKSYREMFQLEVSSAILFNHESLLRRNEYVIKKIIETVKLIKLKKVNKIEMGDINIQRDWGYAPEYMKIMHAIMQSKNNSDFIIATGKSTSLKKILKIVFNFENLDWKKYVVKKNIFFRPNEIKSKKANIIKLKKIIKLYPKKNIYYILKKLYFNE